MKKHKITRVLSIFLAVMLMVTALAGCGGKKATGDEKVTLKWVIGAQGKMADCDKVWTEFNKQLQDYMPGTTVEFEIIPYSDFSEKWNLMSASGEEVDLVWAGWMLDINEEVRKGSFRQMDDLLEYAPDMVKELPQYVLDLGKINNKLYVIPCYQMMGGLPYGMYVQKEQAEKYGLDVEKIEKIFNTDKLLSKEDFKPFEDYLEKLKQAGELNKGVSKYFLDYIMGTYLKGNSPNREQVAANAYIDYDSKDLKVYDLNACKKEQEYFELVNEWFNKGYIRKDILSLTDHNEDKGKKNGYVLWADSCFKGASESATKKYGMDILAVPLCHGFHISHRKTSTNTAIARVSKHPEKAMELINLMNSKKGKDLYNLLVFGIEGTHYKKLKDDKIEWLLPSAPGSSSDNAYGLDAWSVGNTFNAYQTQYDEEGWNDYILNEVNATAEPSPLAGFSLDPSPIKLEISQYNAIFGEYLYLDLGATANYKQLLKERNAKLKKAGSDKIIKEVQRQIDEWKKKK